MQIILTLVFFACPSWAQGQPNCVDHTYFNYDCSQLARYCRVNRAVGIRSSCPLTCGLCQNDQPHSGSGSESGRGIVRLFPNELEETVTKSIIRPVPNLEPTSHVLPPEVIILDQTTPSPKSILVRPDNGKPAPPVEKARLSDSDANERLKKCCNSAKIGPNCASLCSYETRKEEALLKAASGLCTLDDARIWVRCAADGHQNADCCRNRGVTGCDNACNGQLGFDIAQLLGCLNRFFDPILACHKENLL